MATAELHVPVAGQSWPYTFRVLGLEELFVDESYQRPLSRFVKRIVDQFDPALIGTLVVSNRGGRRKAKFAVIDGQTRLAALRQIGQSLGPCLVYEGLDRRGEAKLFARFQSERKNISAVERFRAALMAEEPRAQAINQLVHEWGFVISARGRSNTGNAIVAVKALEDIHQIHGPEVVAMVLEVIVRAWEHQADGSNTNEMLRGVAYFLTHTANVDEDRLIDRLSNVEPAVLTTRAAQLRQGRGHGGKSPSYMAEAIGALYRKRA